MRTRPAAASANGRARVPGFPGAESGIALLALLFLLFLAGIAVYLSNVSATSIQLQRQQVTLKALAQAKEALIGYATAVDLKTSGPRPGDLPCPDLHPLNDPLEGTPSLNCNTSAKQLGRLPWKKLGLPDLRDASGERLWYAVSTNFKNDPRTGTLNSDTVGTITVRDQSDAIKYDGQVSVGTGAIAVIIAPGAPLTRRDGVVQDRSAANYNQPVHYLDQSPGEDNINFTNNNVNGFVDGDVLTNGTRVVNDRMVVILQSELMPALEKRVVNEAVFCLKDYAAQPQNQGRYPWPADLVASASGNYADTTDVLFGRMPDSLTNTATSSGGAMKNGWTVDCRLTLGTWFPNWQEQVFYALGDAYKPINPVTSPTCGSCLSIYAPTLLTNRQVAVIAAGMKLPALGQTRSNKSDVTQYLEGENASYLDMTFVINGAPSPFNDRATSLP